MIFWSINALSVIIFLTVFIDLGSAFLMLFFLMSQLLLLALKNKGLARELFFILHLVFWAEISFSQYRSDAYRYQGFLFNAQDIHLLGKNTPTSTSPIFALKDIKNPYSKEKIGEVIQDNLELLKNDVHRRSFFYYLNAQAQLDSYQKELMRLSSDKEVDDFYQQVCLSLISGKKFNEEALTETLKFHEPLSKRCGLIIDRTWKSNVGQIQPLAH